jgi:hypothetical protein
MCVAAAIGGAAVIGGVANYMGAKKAASSQEAASNAAQQTQMAMYNQTNANLAPFRQTGVAANNLLGSYYGLPGSTGPSSAQWQKTLSNLPGYQFQMNQGVQALDRSAASKGLLTSGATGKALQQYGQGLGSSYAQQYIGGLSNLANQGENAAAMTGQFAQNAGNGIAANQIYAGNASAAGQMGQWNALGNLAGQGIGLYGMYSGGMFGGGGGGGPGGNAYG